MSGVKRRVSGDGAEIGVVLVYDAVCFVQRVFVCVFRVFRWVEQGNVASIALWWTLLSCCDLYGMCRHVLY